MCLGQKHWAFFVLKLLVYDVIIAFSSILENKPTLIFSCSNNFILTTFGNPTNVSILGHVTYLQHFSRRPGYYPW